MAEGDLLSLPYDIRHKIYEHLFPPGQQIYIHVLGKRLRSITPEYSIPTELLSTCRALNQEASEYLYNSYLFNIIGTKQHCLAAYKDFLATVTRYARHEVHVNAFSNGSHSSTMCLSIHSGEGRTAMLRRRERGEPKSITELESEVAGIATSKPLRRSPAFPGAGLPNIGIRIVGAVVALLVLLFSWWISSRI